MPTPEELYGQKAVTPTTGGYTPESIYGAAAQEPESDLGERMLEEAPQTIGGIAGGLAGATKGATAGAAIGGPVGAIAGGIAGGALGAGVGGAAGKGYQQVYRHATGSEKAPATSYEAAVEMAYAGGEEAAWDLGGQLAGRALGKGFHYLRPKAVDDVEKLAVKLEKAGGQMTAAQRTDSWLIHQLDSLTRGSLTGSGRMQAIDTLNEAALRHLETNLRQNMAKNVYQNLSDREFGELFLNTLKEGKAAHRTVVGEMYGGFDDLVPTQTVSKTVTDQVSKGINPATGQEIIESVPRTVATEIKPVQTGKVKEALEPFREQLERIKYAGESADSRKLLDSIFNQDATLRFADAQALRSNLLDAQRNLEALSGKSKISGKVGTAVDALTKAMDEAASKQGKDVLAKYRAIKKYAKTGYKAFDNKFIADMIVADKKAPERIGEHIFRIGNVREVTKAKEALRYASRFNPEIKYDEVWGQMQRGYLDSILQRSTRPSDIPASAGASTIMQEGSDVWGSKLIKEFTDPKKARTLGAVFSKAQRESILEFAKIAERTQRKPEGGLGMLMQLTQGGAILGMMGGQVDPGEAGTLLLGPAVLARIMTHPKGARLLTTAMKTPNTNGRASAVMSQLAGYVHAIQQED